MTPLKWDGNPVSQPGVFANIPIREYHRQLTVGPSISSSGIKAIFSKSPAHYFASSYLNPEADPQDETDALLFGRLGHALLLGDENFKNEFVVRPAELNGKPWNGNRTECKEWVEHVRGQGLTIVTPDQLENVRGMADSLSAHPLVRAGILNGLIEHSIVWKDSETGVWLKTRPDAIPTDDMDFSDLKCVADVSDSALEKSISAFGYNVQGALVGMACREVLGRTMNSFSLVFCEKTPPYCVQIRTLKPADLELGEQQIRASVRAFALCIERGQWPGPGGEANDAKFIEMTPYARTAIQYRLQKLTEELFIK